MPRKRVPVSEKQWKKAADQYELGYTTARVLAASLGVSAATFSREMKRRGATKASRVAETVVELKAYLDDKAREKAALRRAADEAAWARVMALDEMIGRMVRSLVEAKNEDEWADATEYVDKVAQALGTKRQRR